MNVHIIGGNAQYVQLFRSLGFTIVGEVEGCDLVLFTGGEDVSPYLYGDKDHPATFSSRWRDEHEEGLFEYCFAHGIKMVGICRGAQFLNVMSGGRMYQHVDRHLGDHIITDAQTGETVLVSSTHHQMMMPTPEAVLVASSALGGLREWYEGQIFKKDISQEDIEVVYYPNTDCLCFQPHPEFQEPQYEGMRRYFDSLLVRFGMKGKK